MTIQCVAPDGDAGVAIRLASLLDCQSRALGENGFQALAGGPMMASLLSSLVAIFIALIGYRMVLGGVPSVRDGVGWAVRLGIVLALVTSWPAFQTLVYRVTTEGPQELAAVLLPASGVPSVGVEEQVQNAYDVMRLGRSETANMAAELWQSGVSPAGVAGPPGGAAAGANFQPLPQTASLLVVSTIGLVAALRLAVGFLLAVGPIGVLGLLFDGTTGIFNGWVRALSGATLGVLAASITSAIEVLAIGSELSHIQLAMNGSAPASSIDPQALVTIVLLFFVVALVMVFAAARMESAFSLRWAVNWVSRGTAGSPRARAGGVPLAPNAVAGLMPENGSHTQFSRAASVAEALSIAAVRDSLAVEAARDGGAPSRRVLTGQDAHARAAMTTLPIGIAGRRSTGRRTQSARRRDLSR